MGERTRVEKAGEIVTCEYCGGDVAVALTCEDCGSQVCGECHDGARCRECENEADERAKAREESAAEDAWEARREAWRTT